jgi:biotin carboxyl carrier protein
MKMENAVRAPRDGQVKGLRVKVGDAVAAGQVLAELE